MIPSKGFVFEKQQRETDEDDQGNYFLDYLELHQGKRAAVTFIAYSICWDLETIFE